MQYLCASHQRAIARNPSQALVLWQEAMAQGFHCRRQNNLKLARALFGSAFEIALIHAHQQGKGESLFNRQALIDSGVELCEVLIFLQQKTEAEACLRLLRDYLLVAAADRELGLHEREQAMVQYQALGKGMHVLRRQPGEPARYQSTHH